MNQIYMGASFLNNYNNGNILCPWNKLCEFEWEVHRFLCNRGPLFLFLFWVLFGVFSLNTKLFSFLFLIVKSKQYRALWKCATKLIKCNAYTFQRLGKISLAAYVTFRVSGTYCLIGRIVPFSKIPLSCYKVQ